MLEVDGKNDQALASYEKSFAIRQALANDFPANANARRDLAIAHEKIGELLAATGAVSRALPRFEEALKIFEALYQLDPSNANAKRPVGIEYEKMAEALAAADPGRSKQFYLKAAGVYQRMATADPLNARVRSDLERVNARLSKKP
jgi:tetratricopeptide (TPR) repeat protein